MQNTTKQFLLFLRVLFHLPYIRTGPKNFCKSYYRPNQLVGPGKKDILRSAVEKALEEKWGA
ncbi:MAG: hypothetical protein II060_00150, partial [Bacteroidales bacterium]|nr:hypothetical protein [Bacteroidales bacterium]